MSTKSRAVTSLLLINSVEPSGNLYANVAVKVFEKSSIELISTLGSAQYIFVLTAARPYLELVDDSVNIGISR